MCGMAEDDGVAVVGDMELFARGRAVPRCGGCRPKIIALTGNNGNRPRRR